MDTPKISVIVACYNQAHLVEQSLDSILAQDHHSFEIIVGDDGSKDETPRIIQRYADRYPGKVIPVLSPVNQGVTANCNSMLAAIRGELIAVTAGDDLFLPGKLSLQAALFDDPAVVLSYHPVEVFDSDSGRTLYITNQRRSDDLKNAGDIIMKSGIPGSASVMIRRSAIPPGGYDRRLTTVSDWLFFIEVALQGKVAKVDRVLGRYRKHSHGTTARVSLLLEETLYSLDLLLEKHPERHDLPALCRLGKARYLGGEAFRTMAEDPVRARALARQATELAPNDWRYRTLSAVTRFPALTTTLGPAINRAKYALKRFVASG